MGRAVSQAWYALSQAQDQLGHGLAWTRPASFNLHSPGIRKYRSIKGLAFTIVNQFTLSNISTSSKEETVAGTGCNELREMA